MSSPKRHHSRRRGRSRGEEDEDSSPQASPSSWNIQRGRSRVRRPSNPFSEDGLRRRGYHQLHSSFGKTFNVEKRWKLIREMGSGAYGVVISAGDEISGETIAIKLVTRVFEKVQLAKRALREITLLRHFSHHENITGLIDVDAINPDFNEIYIFMEPMEADLHQIIKSGQSLSNEHCQYFIYQVLRGMKYIHSASVVHRDLKPGNLLVNADCELKICDFGLSRGFDASPDENASHLTQYVATRWYRAPEIMLAFSRYNAAIDVWSIGCILAELLMGKPLFKGKDYVDQLNKILDVLGSPEERVVQRIGSDKAQAYVRSLPFRKSVPFSKVIPTADPQAIDLLTKLLAFDPADRITVVEALEHPWLASYHDETDEPVCPKKFEKWRQIEELETLEEFREALWNEIEDYRREVRGGVSIELSGLPPVRKTPTKAQPRHSGPPKSEPPQASVPPVSSEPEPEPEPEPQAEPVPPPEPGPEPEPKEPPAAATSTEHLQPSMPEDPVVKYHTRRSSILQPTRSRVGSTYNSPLPAVPSAQVQASNQPGYFDGPIADEPGPLPSNLPGGGVVFPTQGYIIPARSRTASLAGGEVVQRRLLRTLSTVSIHESLENVQGLAGVAPIRNCIVEGTTAADAPASEMPKEFGIEEESETRLDSAVGGKEQQPFSWSNKNGGDIINTDNSPDEKGKTRTRKEGMFHLR